MQMTLFLLVSAVALLPGPSVQSPVTPIPVHKKNVIRENLNRAFDNADNLIKSLKQDFFVEDVGELAAPRCENAFFCKVHHILDDYRKTHKNPHAETLLRHLNAVLTQSSMKCEELKKGKNSDVTKPLSDLLEHLKKCVQNKNSLGNHGTSTN